MENATALTTSPTEMERRAPREPSASPDTRRGIDFVARPPIDVLESNDGIRLLVDLPGVTADELSVDVEMPQLRIDAARTLADGSRVAYRAALRLPPTIDPGSLSAELRHGVLEIGMTKAEQARARRIAVRTA